MTKPKSLHKGVIDCEYSSCGWMQRGKCECPNHRYEERIAKLEAEVMGLEGCCQILEKAFGVPKKATLKQIDERIGHFVKLETENQKLKDGTELALLKDENLKSLTRSLTERNTELSKRAHRVGELEREVKSLKNGIKTLDKASDAWMKKTQKLEKELKRSLSDVAKGDKELKTAREEAKTIIETDLCTPCRWKIDERLK